MPPSWCVVAALALSIPRALGGNTPSCIKNTGGTCATSGCFSWRGPTECNSFRCVCTGNACAGGDGICTDTPYQASNVTYRIRNARFPEFFMDVDDNRQAITRSTGYVAEKSGHDEHDNRFTITTPFFADEEDHEKNADDPETASCYLISSVRWPKAVLMTQESSNNKQQGKLVTCANVDGGWAGSSNHYSIVDLGMVMTLAPRHSERGDDPPIMLSSLNTPQDYLYVKTTPWRRRRRFPPPSTVSTHHNDPGAGGYWYFEPRLPQELRDSLPKYRGTRCNPEFTSCGTVVPVAGWAGAASLAQVGLQTLLLVVSASVASTSRP